MQFRDYIYARHAKGDYDILYEISDQDVTSNPRYYGYLASDGGWIIMKWDTSANSYRYCMGESDYATNWAVRSTILVYVYYSEL
jgi:hypothetical protein